jgi:DNA polymerase III subunit epsilon
MSIVSVTIHNAKNMEAICKRLKLSKPLVIFDLETTGLVLSMDKIIEVAYIKIMPNGRILKDNLFLNPEMEISKEASEVHGITDADVANMPTFRDKAKEMWDVFNDCYYGGFNVVNFDLPMLKREFIRWVWILNILVM